MTKENVYTTCILHMQNNYIAHRNPNYGLGHQESLEKRLSIILSKFQTLSFPHPETE